jgi:hypothetical protein
MAQAPRPGALCSVGLAIGNLGWCNILAFGPLSFVPLSPDEPHANTKSDKADKYPNLDQKVDSIHPVRTVRAHKTMANMWISRSGP